MSRQYEHERASDAWDDYEGHRAQNDRSRRAANPGIILPPRRGRAGSPTAGLGEQVRSERAAAKLLTSAETSKVQATRAAKMKFLKAQQQKSYVANQRQYARPVDGGRYFPHQSTREMERRVRQGLAPPAVSVAAE